MLEYVTVQANFLGGFFFCSASSASGNACLLCFWRQCMCGNVCFTDERVKIHLTKYVTTSVLRWLDAAPVSSECGCQCGCAEILTKRSSALFFLAVLAMG